MRTFETQSYSAKEPLIYEGIFFLPCVKYIEYIIEMYWVDDYRVFTICLN